MQARRLVSPHERRSSAGKSGCPARQAYVRITEDLLAGDAEGNTELAKLLAEIDPRVEALDAEVDKVANRIDRVRAKMQEQRAVREEDLLDKLAVMTNVLATLANTR